jgi:hypothetical protein
MNLGGYATNRELAGRDPVFEVEDCFLLPSGGRRSFNHKGPWALGRITAISPKAGNISVAALPGSEVCQRPGVRNPCELMDRQKPAVGRRNSPFDRVDKVFVVFHQQIGTTI